MSVPKQFDADLLLEFDELNLEEQAQVREVYRHSLESLENAYQRLELLRRDGDGLEKATRVREQLNKLQDDQKKQAQDHYVEQQHSTHELLMHLEHMLQEIVVHDQMVDEALQEKLVQERIEEIEEECLVYEALLENNGPRETLQHLHHKPNKYQRLAELLHVLKEKREQRLAHEHRLVHGKDYEHVREHGIEHEHVHSHGPSPLPMSPSAHRHDPSGSNN